MSYLINSVNSSENFENTCSHLSHFGEKGYERLQIVKTATGYAPALTGQASFIEKVLAFFGIKRRSLRLNEVAHFSLNWLRVHASDYPESNLKAIKSLLPLMKKANLEKEFNVFLKKISDIKPEKKAESVKPSLTVIHAKDFTFHWPKDFKEADKLEGPINTVLTHFLSHPGTQIRREKKSSVIDLYIPIKGKVSVNIPLKVEFYLEGAINNRKIIVKMKDVVGKGGERKVVRAFDILNNVELVSKPFVNELEKTMISTIMNNNLPGFIPVTAVTNSRFYERRCRHLSSYFNASSPIRRSFIIQLLSGLKAIHQKQLKSLDYYVEQGNTKVTKKVNNVNIYHGDIKPDNILIYEEQGSLKCGFSDLGSLCNIPALTFTHFFRSPEKTRCIQNIRHGRSNMTVDGIVKHNIDFGQTNDVWSLGMVIVTLLTGGSTLNLTNDNNLNKLFKEMGVPNLEIFKKIVGLYKVKTNLGNNDPVDAVIQDIEQNEIDDSLDKLMEAFKDESFKDIWSIVKLMLQVDPAKRIKMGNVPERVT